MIIQSESNAIRMFSIIHSECSISVCLNKQSRPIIHRNEKGYRNILLITNYSSNSFCKGSWRDGKQQGILNPTKWFSRKYALLHSHSHRSYSNLNHSPHNQSSENYSIFSIMASRNDSGFQRFKTEIGSSIIKQQVSLDIGNSNMLYGYLHRYRK